MTWRWFAAMGFAVAAVAILAAGDDRQTAWACLIGAEGMLIAELCVTAGRK